MRKFVRYLSLAFSAGAIGALINSAAVYFCGVWGLTAMFGVDLAPTFTYPWLYKRLVWGGLWALLLLVPIKKSTYYIYRGIILSLLPTLVQLFIIFPVNKKGAMGLDLGLMTPLFVLFYNAVWGVFASVWLDYTRERIIPRS